jgi:hypothetical protein
MTPSGIASATLRLVAQCLTQPRHRVLGTLHEQSLNYVAEFQNGRKNKKDLCIMKLRAN